ncbi:unnamed protein product [Ascophyllum nodosum]
MSTRREPCFGGPLETATRTTTPWPMDATPEAEELFDINILRKHNTLLFDITNALFIHARHQLVRKGATLIAGSPSSSSRKTWHVCDHLTPRGEPDPRDREKGVDDGRELAK